ncbi:hypothetical protein KP509_04G013000 [Ceratopteris richardii]|uniref:Uncharacterized protein n=1 Tax=Ceratopteris richardii TaxID=49495 RepID=A0A8T2UUN7_CERRI|nr:hypothetical protein KP509_04G013000 [Ceratopteris richardii]
MAGVKNAITPRSFVVSLALLFLSVCQASAELIYCEDLPVEKCAFAVSSHGLRCTSSIIAEKPKGLLESDQCIKTCGLQRLSVGFSTDALMEDETVQKLCLSDCRKKCPNINDLFTKLAEGEGIDLDSMCKDVKEKIQRHIAAQRHSKQTTAGDAQPSRARRSVTSVNKPEPNLSSYGLLNPPPGTCTVTCTPAQAEPPMQPAWAPMKSPNNLPYYRRNNPALSWGEQPAASSRAPSTAWSMAPQRSSSRKTPPTVPRATVAAPPVPAARSPPPPSSPPSPPPPSSPPSPPPPSSPPPPPPSSPPPPPPVSPPPPPPIPDIFHGLFRRRRFPPV